MDAFVDKAVEELDNDYVEEEGRVLVCRTDFYNLIKENSSWD
jgi:hypothetical protein